MLEKRKHNLIPSLFELRTTCSLLKQLVWLFIILLLTTITHAHMEKCFMCCSEEFSGCFFSFFSLFHAVVFPVLTLYIKGFHFVMTCEMSHHKVCEEMRCSWTSAFYCDWYFGKRVMGNLAVIATTECT